MQNAPVKSVFWNSVKFIFLVSSNLSDNQLLILFIYLLKILCGPLDPGRRLKKKSVNHLTTEGL